MAKFKLPRPRGKVKPGAAPWDPGPGVSGPKSAMRNAQTDPWASVRSGFTIFQNQELLIVLSGELGEKPLSLTARLAWIALSVRARLPFNREATKEDVARAMGVDPRTAHRALEELRQAGLAERNGAGYYLAVSPSGVPLGSTGKADRRPPLPGKQAVMVYWKNLLWKTRLPSTEKLVLRYLLDCSNAEGRSWPLVDTIASETGFSRRTVLGALKRLRERGVLSWEFHGRGNVYQVHLEALEGLAQEGKEG